MPNLTLSQIWIYPVKSLGGMPLSTANVSIKGLQYDRRWMLIDQDGVAMTQRVYPEMSLFKVSISDDELRIACTRDQKVVSSCSFKMSTPYDAEELTARIWNDNVQVHEVDPEISQWFSEYLQRTCKLVRFPEENPRPVDPKYRVGQEHVSLADAYPFLIIGESSLDDLNKRLDEPLPMNRFRPNFVFTGGAPFLEDSWRNFSIGNLRFVAVKKCGRCVLTTVDQDSGEKGAEPLRTLSTYRKADNKINFGQNLVALDEGPIAVGEVIIPG